MMTGSTVARLSRSLLPLLAAFIAAGCNSDESSGPSIEVASLTIVTPSSSVVVGRTLQLQAVARDAEGFALTGVDVDWTTSNANVATVTPTGRVTGVAIGTVTISARAIHHDREDSINITVRLDEPA